MNLRSSSIHHVCTYKPDLSLSKLNSTKAVLSIKAGDKKETFDGSLVDAQRLADVKGLKLVADAFIKAYMDLEKAKVDPLPDGAKSYLQKLWLETEKGLKTFSLREDAVQLMKGNLCEEGAISVLNQMLGIFLTKNETRLSKGVLSGECDITYDNKDSKVIRDIKCPIDWMSFRKKQGIDSVYYWQLISYCYLYGATEAYLDYVLMPSPPEVIGLITKWWSEEDTEAYQALQDTIEKYVPTERIKTFKIDSNDISDDIAFLKTRLKKAEKYYNSLTYEICMGL